MRKDWRTKLILLILLLVNYQTFSQVIELNKNQKFPYDSGIGMPLETYRYWRIKTIKSDSLILSKNKTILLLERKSTELEYKISLKDSINLSFNRDLIRKDTTIKNLNSLNTSILNDCVKQQSKNKKKSIYKTLFFSTISLLLGLIIT